MLNPTKEGIVVQFLPEAKDFWASLNQIYENTGKTVHSMVFDYIKKLYRLVVAQ